MTGLDPRKKDAHATGARRDQKPSIAGNSWLIMITLYPPVPLEGTNNKIKPMQQQAYGFRDHEFFKLEILNLHETRYALAQNNFLDGFTRFVV